jgi:vacuolar-type H+-ATPase subunit E/Vma4
MSDGSAPGPETGIVDKILSDGKAQAQRLIDSAKRSAEGEIAKAQQEAQKVRQEIVSEAQRKVRTLMSKEAAGAHIESKRMLLRAREEAISSVFKIIEQGLVALRDNQPDYVRALGSLATEAAAAVGGPRVSLKVGPRDKDLVDHAFLDAVERRIKETTQQDIKLELVVDPELSGGGCMAASEDGRIVFDNTFRRRLERMKHGLRDDVVREVLKADA